MIDNLIRHAYLHSISDVLVKLMQIEENYFSDEIAIAMEKRKIEIVNNLVAMLACADDD